MEMFDVYWFSVFAGTIALIWIVYRQYGNAWIVSLGLLSLMIAISLLFVLNNADCSRDRSSCGGLIYHVIWMYVGLSIMPVINVIMVGFVVVKETAIYENKTNKNG